MSNELNIGIKMTRGVNGTVRVRCVESDCPVITLCVPHRLVDEVNIEEETRLNRNI